MVLRGARSPGSTGSFCIVKSRAWPGRLYSYGPRYATGVIRKFPCGGGEGAVHSSVVASHGLSLTFLPCLMLQKKLMMNGIWRTNGGQRAIIVTIQRIRVVDLAALVSASFCLQSYVLPQARWALCPPSARRVTATGDISLPWRCC